MGVRVGMFEMRGIEGISADKIFTIDGNIRANGMGNTIDNVSEAGTRASQCVLCSIVTWNSPNRYIGDPATSSQDGR